MQIERLVQMVFYIAGREHVTAKELANRFQVSTRTIYRDLNTLSLAGIPVMSAKGTGGGIFLLDGYTIEKTIIIQGRAAEYSAGPTDITGLQLSECGNYIEQNRRRFPACAETGMAGGGFFLLGQ